MSSVSMPKTQETIGWNSIDMILLFQEKLIKHAIGEKISFSWDILINVKLNGDKMVRTCFFLLECNDYFTFKGKKKSLDGALLFF